MYYVTQFDDKFFVYEKDKPKNHRKALTPFVFYAIKDLANYYERVPKSEKSKTSFLYMLHYSMTKNKHKGFIIDTKLKKELEKAFKETQAKV